MKHSFRKFPIVLLICIPLLSSAQSAPQGRGALFVGSIADACTTSAMSAGILSASRDKGVSQSDAKQKLAELLAKDPNRDFHLGLVDVNSEIVFGFPAISKASQEQIALARCARFAKAKPTLSNEGVIALIPAITKCQSSNEDALASKCIFSVVYGAHPQ